MSEIVAKRSTLTRVLEERVEELEAKIKEMHQHNIERMGWEGSMTTAEKMLEGCFGAGLYSDGSFESIRSWIDLLETIRRSREMDERLVRLTIQKWTVRLKEAETEWDRICTGR